MKSNIKKIINKFVFLINVTIPNILSLIFAIPFIKINIASVGVKHIKVFNFKHWHLGYKYFIGFYNEKKVFIKYNSNKNIILNEYDNLEYIKNNSLFLKNIIPVLYLKKEVGESAFIVEEFYEYNNLNYYIRNNIEINYNKIYKTFIEIIKEFQKIGFMHLDINKSNIFLDDNCNVFLIDFGFSLIKGNNFDFLPKKIRKFVIKHLNDETRLDIGYIDDAISFLIISSYINNNFISSNRSDWLIMNKLSGNLYYKV